MENNFERVAIGQSSNPGPPRINIRVLVVDDDATTLAVVSSMLQICSYKGTYSFTRRKEKEEPKSLVIYYDLSYCFYKELGGIHVVRVFFSSLFYLIYGCGL